MSFRELLADISYRTLVAGDAVVADIAIDSREVRPGCLFVARRGWYSDGHRFISAALEAGAVALVVSDETQVPEGCSCPVVLVEHEDPALGLLSARFYGWPTRELTVFGVTGTNGKTSTVWMLDHILREAGRKVALLGTTGYRIGGRWLPAPNTTPDALVVQRLAREALDAGDDTLVLEVSSHACAHGRVVGCDFDVQGFTNFSRDHLDFHGDEQAYFSAKALFSQLYGRTSRLHGKRPVALVVGDDAGGQQMQRAVSELPALDEHTAHLGELLTDELLASEPPELRTLSVLGEAVGADLDFRVEVDDLALSGIVLRHQNGTDAGQAFRIPLVGRYQGQNAALAAAMAAAGIAELSMLSALEYLQTFAGVPGRLEAVAPGAPDEPRVFVDYAHTPDAVENASAALASVAPGGLCVVLGAGGDRDAGKRPLMCAAALKHAKLVILTSDNPRSENAAGIIAAMRAGASSAAPVRVIADRFEAIGAALQSGCEAILVAGKGHEDYEEVLGHRYAWSDRSAARALLAQRRWQLETAPYLSGWTLAEMADACDGALDLRGADPLTLVSSLSSDTRTLQHGALFVALVGDNHDGHCWVAQAADKGAAAAIVAHPVDVDIPQIVVPDTLHALQQIASALLRFARRTRGGLWVRAITGSNGKTTTRAILEAIVGSLNRHPVLATRGNYNNHIGVPLTVARLGWQHRSAVLEMGANGVGDIAELVAIAPPDVSVITSIGRAHLEGFGSEENIRLTKRELISAASPRYAIVPCEEAGRGWQEVIDARGAKAFWIGPSGLLDATRDGERGIVELRGHGEWEGYRARVLLPLIGAHNARNLATALVAACSRSDGLLEPPDSAELQRALATIELPDGRLESYERQGRRVIFDAYNANPTSMVRALDILATSEGLRVAVLGVMRELGVQSDELHREVAEHAQRCCDVLVVVGAGWPSDIQATHIVDGGDAARKVAACATVGATLLWKGSRGARLELLRDAVESIWKTEAS